MVEGGAFLVANEDVRNPESSDVLLSDLQSWIVVVVGNVEAKS